MRVIRVEICAIITVKLPFCCFSSRMRIAAKILRPSSIFCNKWLLAHARSNKIERSESLRLVQKPLKQERTSVPLISTSICLQRLAMLFSGPLTRGVVTRGPGSLGARKDIHFSFFLCFQFSSRNVSAGTLAFYA